MCIPYPYKIYYTNEFICIVILDFASLVYFYLVLCMLTTVGHIFFYLSHSDAC